VLVNANLGLGKIEEAAQLLRRTPQRDASLDASLRELERSERSRKPVSDASLASELDGIKSSLARGQCSEASERARQSFERWTPNPKALTLAAAAAECQGDTSSANRFYARAAAEFETSCGLAWVELDTVRPSEFSAPNELLVRLGNGLAVLSIGSHEYEPVTLTPVRPKTARSLWRDEAVEVYIDQNTLIGRALATQETAWQRKLPFEYSIVPAFSAGELLLLHPELAPFRTFWYRLDSRTGKVVSKGIFPASYGQVFVSKRSDWFAATAGTADRQPHLLELVFSSGESKRVELETLAPCSPEAVLSPQELLLVCPEGLRALSVDTLRQRPLARFPDGFLAFSVDSGPDNLWALRGSPGLAVATLSPDGAQFSLEVLAEFKGSNFSSVTWSPTGRMLAGDVGGPDGRRGTVLWDVESQRTLLEFWHEPKGQYPDAAVSATGDELALGGCNELGRLDLEHGRLDSVPLPTPDCAGYTVAPATGVLRVPARSNGPAVFWPKRGAPRPIKLGSPVKELQAVGPWVAANLDTGGRLFLPGTDQTLLLPPNTRVLALSPDGNYAALREVVPGSHHDILLSRLDQHALASYEVWRLSKSEYQYAAFTPDSQALMLWAATGLARLDLNTSSLTTLDARWPDRGARLLDETRLLSGYSLIPLDAAKPAPTALSLDLKLGTRANAPPTFPLLAFSARARLVAGPSERGAGIWNATSGELVAQIQRSPAGGWFVIAAADADDQRSLVQPLGTERMPLWCRAGHELYDWRVCQDRFEEPTLLAKLLTGRSDSPGR